MQPAAPCAAGAALSIKFFCWPGPNSSVCALSQPAGMKMSCLQVHGGYSSDEQESHTGSYSRPQLASAPQASPLGPGTTTAASHSGTDEVALVDDLCAPRGMRAQPDRDDLKQFVETAASMNGRLIAERLQAKMVGTCLLVAALCRRLHGKRVCAP